MISSRLEPGTEEFKLALEAEMVRRTMRYPTQLELIRARENRAVEKARYLEINEALFSDALARWHSYEDGILDKYSIRQYPPHRRVHALDVAWALRDRVGWVRNRNNK